MIKAAIFDVDGVLADSIPMHFNIWKNVLKECGVDIEYKEWMPFIGRIGPDFIRHINESRGLDLDPIELRDRKHDITEKLYTSDLNLFKGAKELLKALHDHGYKLAVGSSEWRNNVMHLLKRFSVDSYFSAILGLEDIENHKPEPDIYLKAAKHLGVEPSQCVVFEDSLTGVKAAKNAGMKCIAVETSFPEKDLAEADIVVKSLQEKEKIIEFIRNN